jgi:hypothetical protein
MTGTVRISFAINGPAPGRSFHRQCPKYPRQPAPYKRTLDRAAAAVQSTIGETVRRRSLQSHDHRALHQRGSFSEERLLSFWRGICAA